MSSRKNHVRSHAREAAGAPFSGNVGWSYGASSGGSSAGAASDIGRLLEDASSPSESSADLFTPLGPDYRASPLEPGWSGSGQDGVEEPAKESSNTALIVGGAILATIVAAFALSGGK